MSSELEEFIGFCSRVVVFREGSIFETFINEQINADGILESMFGHRQNPSFEKELNSQSTEKNNDQTKLKNLTNKKQSDNKLETEVKKHNISNYFNKKTEKISPVIATKTGFSAKDEEQFNNILNSTKKNSYKEKFDQKQKNDQYQEKYDYSENDSKKFEELIASGEQLIRKKGKSSYRNNKNKETYSISDEELFNKHLSLNQDNSHTQNLNKKAAKINKEQLFNREHNSSESKTFEYNEKDVAQFEKLMSKK
jgi:hypothetical protein